MYFLNKNLFIHDINLSLKNNYRISILLFLIKNKCSNFTTKQFVLCDITIVYSINFSSGKH